MKYKVLYKKQGLACYSKEFNNYREAEKFARTVECGVIYEYYKDNEYGKEIADDVSLEIYKRNYK